MFKKEHVGKVYTITDDLRISVYDTRNIAIQYLTEVGQSPKEKQENKKKETRYKWRNVAYYPTVETALMGILQQELLLEPEREQDIVKVIEQSRKQKEIIEYALENYSFAELEEEGED